MQTTVWSSLSRRLFNAMALNKRPLDVDSASWERYLIRSVPVRFSRADMERIRSFVERISESRVAACVANIQMVKWVGCTYFIYSLTKLYA